jgi:hypothetical protein
MTGRRRVKSGLQRFGVYHADDEVGDVDATCPPPVRSMNYHRGNRRINNDIGSTS